MNRLIIVCICSLALSISSFAQAPTASPIATTPPEVQRLAYYLGTWRGEGETKRGPFGPAGKRTFLNILAYDEKANAYTEYGISSLGESEYSTGGSIVGNKRTFVKDLDSDVKGKLIKLRYTEVQVSPTIYTYQAEASKDGGPWTVIADGKVAKIR